MREPVVLGSNRRRIPCVRPLDLRVANLERRPLRGFSLHFESRRPYHVVRLSNEDVGLTSRLLALGTSTHDWVARRSSSVTAVFGRNLASEHWRRVGLGIIERRLPSRARESRWSLHGGRRNARSCWCVYLESLNSEARVMLDLLPDTERKPLGGSLRASSGESVRIPYRIYNAEPTEESVARLTPLQQTVLHCLYTRHHDGFVRQTASGAGDRSSFLWVVLYVVQLMGESVVEILGVLADRLDLETRHGVSRLACATDDSLRGECRIVSRRPPRRVTSYWNCYYRFRLPDRSSTRRSVCYLDPRLTCSCDPRRVPQQSAGRFR